MFFLLLSFCSYILIIFLESPSTDHHDSYFSFFRSNVWTLKIHTFSPPFLLTLSILVRVRFNFKLLIKSISVETFIFFFLVKLAPSSFKSYLVDYKCPVIDITIMLLIFPRSKDNWLLVLNICHCLSILSLINGITVICSTDHAIYTDNWVFTQLSFSRKSQWVRRLLFTPN